MTGNYTVTTLGLGAMGPPMDGRSAMLGIASTTGPLGAAVGSGGSSPARIAVN